MIAPPWENMRPYGKILKSYKASLGTRVNISSSLLQEPEEECLTLLRFLLPGWCMTC